MLDFLLLQLLLPLQASVSVGGKEVAVLKQGMPQCGSHASTTDWLAVSINQDPSAVLRGTVARCRIREATTSERTRCFGTSRAQLQ